MLKRAPWQCLRGRRWLALGEIGDRPAAFAAYANGRMYAALEGGIIKHSTDGGRSWRLLARAGPAPTQ